MLGRASKARTAKRQKHNVHDFSGDYRSLDLEAASAWRKITSEEEANVTMVPKDKRKNQKCMNAKADELPKLFDSDVYTKVDDKE